MRTALTLIAALSTSFWLVACGDSPASLPPAQTSDATEVPASAGASDAAFVSYTQSLAPSETQEPLKVDQVTPPTNETDEPMKVS